MPRSTGKPGRTRFANSPSRRQHLHACIQRNLRHASGGMDIATV
ncbi:hypothetical protein ACNKHK_09340 [Shigella flexneri]